MFQPQAVHCPVLQNANALFIIFISTAQCVVPASCCALPSAFKRHCVVTHISLHCPVRFPASCCSSAMLCTAQCFETPLRFIHFTCTAQCVFQRHAVPAPCCALPSAFKRHCVVIHTLFALPNAFVQRHAAHCPMLYRTAQCFQSCQPHAVHCPMLSAGSIATRRRWLATWRACAILNVECAKRMLRAAFRNIGTGPCPCPLCWLACRTSWLSLALRRIVMMSLWDLLVRLKGRSFGWEL